MCVCVCGQEGIDCWQHNDEMIMYVLCAGEKAEWWTRPFLALIPIICPVRLAEQWRSPCTHPVNLNTHLTWTMCKSGQKLKMAIVNWEIAWCQIRDLANMLDGKELETLFQAFNYFKSFFLSKMPNVPVPDSYLCDFAASLTVQKATNVCKCIFTFFNAIQCYQSMLVAYLHG